MEAQKLMTIMSGVKEKQHLSNYNEETKTYEKGVPV